MVREVADLTQPGVSHAEELDLIRRRVINVVGHELRTPITTLRGLTEQLLVASPEQIRDELAPALVRNARRVELLLDDLLLAAEVSTALPVAAPVVTDVVAEVRAAWEGLAHHPPTELTVEGPERAPVLARPGALPRIFGHVLDNAVKYGEPPVTVTVRPDGPDWWEVVIESGGSPVPASDLKLATELFYRGERAVTTAPGFGIGLPVARTLARQDGGDLLLEGRRDGGVRVTVRLPAAPEGT